MAIDIYNDSGAEKRGEILRRINQALPGAPTIRPGKALALTADNKVVDHDDEAAEFLLVGEHGTLPADLAEELGIGEYKRTAEEESAVQARISAGKGNVGVQPVPATEKPAEASGVTMDAGVVPGASMSFGGGAKPEEADKSADADKPASKSK